MQSHDTVDFCISLYTLALKKSEQQAFDEGMFRKEVELFLKNSKISYSSIKKIVSVPKSQLLEDLIQIARDRRIVIQTSLQYRKKLLSRAKMQFSNEHKEYLLKAKHKNLVVKKVVEMYQQNQTQNLNEDTIKYVCDKIQANTAFLVGLTKANGVIVQNKFLVTCAHALMDQEDKIVNFKCFVTGNGAYGIIKTSKDKICSKTDVAIAQIVKFFSSKQKSHTNVEVFSLSLKIPESLKFKRQFSPIKCIQLGLLFNNQQQDSFIKVFQPAQGFIERNLYNDQKDYSLIDEMGLLVHNCYGLWGTSGSPLWNQKGELIGIHNSWNENGYNISMIVHDDEDENNIRVIKQYERRGIGVHVLLYYFEKWIRGKDNMVEGMIENQQQFKLDKGELSKTRKKVKIN